MISYFYGATLKVNGALIRIAPIASLDVFEELEMKLFEIHTRIIIFFKEKDLSPDRTLA